MILVLAQTKFVLKDERCLGFDNALMSNDQAVIDLNSEIEGQDKEKGTSKNFRFNKRTIRLRREAARKRNVDSSVKAVVSSLQGPIGVSFDGKSLPDINITSSQKGVVKDKKKHERLVILITGVYRGTFLSLFLVD